jgi:nucleotide-binding universal stress UspA family protein
VIRARKVGQAITEHAREHSFDLIAMSTHGRSGFRHLVLGSITENVLRSADRPVLVFPRAE